MNQEQEIWKEVKDYEGLYEINQFGTVRSLHKRRFHYILEKRIDRGGYYTVRLYKPEKKSCTVYIHRLMGFAFIDNPKNKCCINHIDGEKLNNDLSNLEWVTYSENGIHAYKTGLTAPYNCREIINNYTGKLYSSLKVAAHENGYPYSTFKNFMNGNRPNPTALRYRDATPVGTYKKYLLPTYLLTTEDWISKPPIIEGFHSMGCTANKELYQAGAYNKLYPLFYTPVVGIAGQNSFSTPFNLSDWRVNSLTA